MTGLILSSKNNEPTMSSRDIAEVVGSRHDAVKRTIERLSTDQLTANGSLKRKAVIVRPPVVDEQIHDSFGRPRTESVFMVGKRDSYVVVAQLSPEFTARLVDRWQELESKADLPAWAKNISKEALIALEDLNTQVEHFRSESDRLNTVCNDLAANLREGITPAAFARMLNGVNTNRVQPVLVERKRLLKTQHGYRAAAAYRDKLFTERRHINEEGRLCERVVLTLRGAKWLYAEYEKGQLEMKKDWDGERSHLMLGEVEAA
jgi:phage regulator Rha-like protein